MTKTELAKAAAELGIDVPKGATAADIEKLIEAATAAASDTAAAEPEGDVSPGPDETAPADPGPEMLAYDAEVADLVAVVSQACSTPWDHSFVTFKAGAEVTGPLAAALVAAGLAEPKD
jgi:hypothetical protein